MVTFRLKLILAIFLVFILSLSVIESVPAAGSREPLSMAMESTGAKVEEFSVNAWVKLPSGKLTDEQLGNMVHEVMSQLEILPQDYQLIHQQKNENIVVQAEVVSENSHTLVKAQIVPGG